MVPGFYEPLPTVSERANPVPGVGWAGWLALAVALTPALAGVWSVSRFVTQDGPAHLYNASILLQALQTGTTGRPAFAVHWEPLPNWSGHLATMALLATLPPWLADRIMTSLTLVGFSASILWLRGRVAGPRGAIPGAIWAALVGLNIAWLLGFTSFLLGACLLPITLGVWWTGRDNFSRRRAWAIAGLFLLGYFCHLVSLVLTAFALVILALTTPGPDRRRRLVRTAAAGSVLVPLALVYRGLMAGGGPLRPIWGTLRDVRGLDSWRAQVLWVDPITIVVKGAFPFVAGRSVWFGLLSPIVLFGLAGLALVLASLRRLDWHDRAPWAILAALLLVGAVVCPDTLGPGHGNYLPQRVALLGLVVLLPALELEPNRWGVRLGGLGLVAALAIQSGFIWEYGRLSDRRVGKLVRAGEQMGRGRRVGTLLIDQRSAFRANSILHADCLLGLGNDNTIWSNYEAAHYYFPVRFRPDVPHPPALLFERISILDDPSDAPARARLWRDLLARHHGEIDTLIVWGCDPTLDAITNRWFEPVLDDPAGPVRRLRRRPAMLPENITTPRPLALPTRTCLN